MGTAQTTGQTFMSTVVPIRTVFFSFEKLLNIYIKRLTRVTLPVWLGFASSVACFLVYYEFIYERKIKNRSNCPKYDILYISYGGVYNRFTILHFACRTTIIEA